MLTVLQMLPSLEAGGVEKGTLEIVGALAGRGHRALVMSAGGRMERELGESGGEHVCWPVGRKSLATLRLVPRLRRFLREQQVDILHARSRVPAWIAWLAWRGMDPVSRPRFVTTVHGFYSVNRFSAVMTRGERIIAVSDSARRYVLDNYPSIDPTRITVIHRGIDRDLYPYGYQPPGDWLGAWRRQYPQLAGRTLLTLPGRISRLKGHHALLECVRSLLDDGFPVHGLVVGEAPARKQAYLRELKMRARELGVDAHVTFTGHRSDLREILAVSDLVLSLSGTPESFGRTTLEALSLGRPVIGYDHGGVGEQLAAVYPEGRIPPGDARALREKIAEWLRGGPPPVPGEHSFTLARMLEQTLTLYESLCPGK